MRRKAQISQLKSRHKEPAARNIYGTDSPPQMLYCETKVALRNITHICDSHTALNDATRTLAIRCKRTSALLPFHAVCGS